MKIGLAVDSTREEVEVAGATRYVATIEVPGDDHVYVRHFTLTRQATPLQAMGALVDVLNEMQEAEDADTG